MVLLDEVKKEVSKSNSIAEIKNNLLKRGYLENDIDEALKKLKETALSGGNIFAVLMDTVRVASLGQISHALYEVGGKYRRNM